MNNYTKNPLEKLWLWKEAAELNNLIKQLLKEVKFEFELKDQIDRSSQSVCDNIAEMSGAFYPKVKIQSLRVSRKEALETVNHIEKFRKRQYWSYTVCDNFIKRYNRLIFGINKYIHYLSLKIKD